MSIYKIHLDMKCHKCEQISKHTRMVVNQKQTVYMNCPTDNCGNEMSVVVTMSDVNDKFV